MKAEAVNEGDTKASRGYGGRDSPDGSCGRGVWSVKDVLELVVVMVVGYWLGQFVLLVLGLLLGW